MIWSSITAAFLLIFGMINYFSSHRYWKKNQIVPSEAERKKTMVTSASCVGGGIFFTAIAAFNIILIA